MKTANELAEEYWEKTPMERLHTTLQDYVYDYQQEKIDKALTQINNHKESCIARRSIKRMSASDSEFSEIDIHEENMRILGDILK